MPTDAAAKLPEIEHIKARKDGLDVLADIYRYAELGFDAIEPDDLALFRWYGVYTQRAAESAASGEPGPSEQTDGLFMLRIKFPNGIVTAEQLRAIGRLSVRYGRGMGDITTRQNIQLHWLRIEDLPVVLDELNAVGLSFTQACGDVWRNVVGCPLAGVDGHELLDSRPLIAELERTFVGDKRFSNLPRKFKVSVSGCLHRCAQHEINDIGLVAVEREGVVGYDVWVGGGLGASARMGRRLDAFVRPRRLPRCAPRSPRSSATRASAPSGHGRASSSWSTSGAWSACGPRSSARSAAACRRRSSPPTRSTRTATTWVCIRRSSLACTTWARRRCGAASAASR